MKRITIIAAVLALSLTACSFFNNNRIEETAADIEDGNYSCHVTLTGGSGKATVESPAEVVVSDEGNTVKLVWSSSHYDYMKVEDIRYDNEAAEGENSVFTIPFSEFDEEFTVIGDTTAMSVPHEIEYGLTVYAPGSKLHPAVKLSPKESDEEIILEDLTYVGSLKLDYATQFTVDYYKDAVGNIETFINIGEGENLEQYLFMDEDKLDKTYLVSTSVMDLISKIDALDNIRFSGTDSKDWYIKAAKEKMSSGDILYAGKYSAPDYELLLSEGCNFAIENTMIYHNPEVKEKLEELGITVLVERSSYEQNPLGRLEWIKLYGVLFDKLDEATAFFEDQESRIKEISKSANTKKTVAFFSISSNGQVVVRKPGDYITSMISMAGGNYVPAELEAAEDNALSTQKITMEDFYLQAKDADILIYNSTIEGELSDVTELLSKAEILEGFKAVKSDNVYCLGKDYFQKSADVAEFIEDIYNILKGNDSGLKYIYKLKE
ncbi:ABC transporter substrate-binding protein [Pseudobutyrivibrio xylanivorans]|uniref:ABC transporter substrate-binding protein n=1 Tax=Pseudobutyrivibrio xylanivorans TaxID=185007 RepID=A0A5P6VTL2_PSEXY|nr:ABC transporter substrate-binding protein [Pseudobutyrivibrio xylanivorans]QFJ55963.1 ABC transporter substrate-binding protein [Pseudobutyrivibrio xylanivorans]